ncbi:MAG TPA: hypothetical protein DCO72_04815 [Ruminococcus sp.]|nr:hypothetical protein [Ruminococcus sp.]
MKTDPDKAEKKQRDEKSEKKTEFLFDVLIVLGALIIHVGGLLGNQMFLCYIAIGCAIFVAVGTIRVMHTTPTAPEPTPTTEMKKAVIPYGNISIEQMAFYECYHLGEVEIPDTVTTIGEKAFYNCRRLYKMELPPYLERIEANAFCYCQAVFEWKIPSTVKYIGECAFFKVGFAKIDLPENIAEIEIKYGAFSRGSYLCFTRNGRKFDFELHNAWQEKPEEQSLAEFLKNPTAETFRKMKQSYYKIPLSLGYYDIDKSIRNYLKGCIQQVVPELIHRKELETISVLLNDGIITKKNIDNFIDLAIDEAQKGGSFEIQMLLTDYKAKHFGFESIEDRFRL